MTAADNNCKTEIQTQTPKQTQMQTHKTDRENI